jgi:pimeloyl-ACP methyl ester carboxylesterase
VPDQRGYSPGARPADASAYRVPELAADVTALLDALAITGPVHLIGHDWGAMVGWHLAAHSADRLRTWTAVSVPHPAAMAWGLATDGDQRERSAYISFFRQAEGVAESALLADDAARLRQIFADSGLDAAGVDSYVAPMLVPGALTGALNWYRALRGGPDLAPARVPTTYVWSDNDLAIGRTAAQACHRHVSADYEFVELSGVTHWIPDQVPDRLAGIILTRVRADTTT